MKTSPLKMRDLYPVVTDDEPITTEDPVYKSVQTVEFPDGKLNTFASTKPYPAGTAMGFSQLDARGAHTIGDLEIDFLVPNNFDNNEPFIPPANDI